MPVLTTVLHFDHTCMAHEWFISSTHNQTQEFFEDVYQKERIEFYDDGSIFVYYTDNGSHDEYVEFASDIQNAVEIFCRVSGQSYGRRNISKLSYECLVLGKYKKLTTDDIALYAVYTLDFVREGLFSEIRPLSYLTRTNEYYFHPYLLVLDDLDKYHVKIYFKDIQRAHNMGILFKENRDKYFELLESLKDTEEIRIVDMSSVDEDDDEDGELLPESEYRELMSTINNSDIIFRPLSLDSLTDLLDLNN